MGAQQSLQQTTLLSAGDHHFGSAHLFGLRPFHYISLIQREAAGQETPAEIRLDNLQSRNQINECIVRSHWHALLFTGYFLRQVKVLTIESFQSLLCFLCLLQLNNITRKIPFMVFTSVLYFHNERASIIMDMCASLPICFISLIQQIK